MRTRLKATWIGSLAAQTLQSGNGNPVGTVTNTFPNSFYAKTSNDELLFVTNRSLRSPVTVNINSAANIQEIVKPNETITVEGSEIRLGESAYVELENAIEYDPDAPDFASSRVATSIRDSLRTIAVILRMIDTAGSVLDRAGIAHEAACTFVPRGALALRSQNSDQFKKTCESLLGLGSGFTPSGDDLLGGFLAVFNSLAEKFGREQILLDSALLKSRTNWVSAKLLDYMQRLILDEQMSRIIWSGVADGGDEFVLALESLLPRGHTSGIDIAAGVVLGLSLAQDIAMGSPETEDLAMELGLVS